MNTFSSYKVKIKHYNHIFEQKIEPSRDILFFLNSYEEVKLAYSTETNYFSQFVKNIPPTHKLLRVGFVTQDDYFEAVRFCEYLVNKLKYDKNIVVQQDAYLTFSAYLRKLNNDEHNKK